MFRIGMLLSCIFMTNSTLEEKNYNGNNDINSILATNLVETDTISSNNQSPSSHTHHPDWTDFDQYAVTCYICVNVSDNLVCNRYAIDRPCKPGETFCHTLHIMDSKGTSVLVNKKCTTDKECQRNKVGCVDIDSQTMCVSCCDQKYCNVDVPTNSSTAIYSDKITKMRMLAKNLFSDREKALTTVVKDPNSNGSRTGKTYENRLLLYVCTLAIVYTTIAIT